MKRILAAVLAALFAHTALYAKNAYDIYVQGLTKYQVHNYTGAVKDFKKAIKMKPDFVKPYNKAGLAYMAMKKRHIDHAIYMYKQAIHIDPQYAEAYYNLGVAYEFKFKGKSTEKAEEMYRKAIAINKDDFVFARASLNLARIYRERGGNDEAIALIREAVKREPDFPKLYNEAGRNYFDSGLNSFAIKHYEKALELENRYPEAATNLAVVLMKEGNVARAISLLEDTIKKDPQFAGAQYEYANAMFVKGFYAKAEAHYKRAIKNHWHDVRNSLIYDIKRNPVMEFFAKISNNEGPSEIPLDREFYQAYLGLGKAQQSQNKFKEAMESFRKTVEINKDYLPGVAALAGLKALEESFRDHIVFKKQAAEEGEPGAEEVQEEVPEGEEGEGTAQMKKYKDWEENVEALRLEEEKKQGAEELDF